MGFRFCYLGWRYDTNEEELLALFLLILAGIVLGGFIGSLASDAGVFGWLGYGQSFGMDSPLVLNLGVLVITFGLSIHITMASIIGVVIAIIIYRLL